jgi:hypothetical protein
MDASAIRWTIGGYVVVASIGFFCGVRFQIIAAKIKARNAALAKIDELMADFRYGDMVVQRFGNSIKTLNPLVFDFSSQLCKRGRLKIGQEWDEYKALQITQQVPFRHPFDLQLPPLDASEVEKERKAILDKLSRLRDIIANS